MACHRSPCQGTFRYFDVLPGTLRYLVEGEILRGFQAREGRGWPCHRSPCQWTFRYFDVLPGTLRYLVEGEILRGFQAREGRGWPCHRSPCQGTGGSRAPILPHFPHTRATSREITLGAETSNLQNTAPSKSDIFL